MDDSRHGDTARNIDAILKLERENKKDLTPLQRAFHGVGWFVGTVYFACFQAVLLITWIGLNIGPAHLRVPFDPYPFPLLSAFLAFEAVLLTSFVLAHQTNLDQQSNRRNHIDLQINMLAEDESARTLRLLRQIGEKLGIEEQEPSEVRETSVEKIARHLKSREE